MTIINPDQLVEIDMNSDEGWYVKLKANRALAQTDDRVSAIQAWAQENYERGADVIVEAFEPDEILTDIVRDAPDVDTALQSARDFCGLRREVENDVRGYGDLPPLPNGPFS